MSATTHAPGSFTSPNKLLARLPPEDYRRLLPDLDTIRLRPKRVLLTPHVRAQKVYFPGGGVCSISTVTADGQMAAVAMVGNEGLIGLNAFGNDPGSAETSVVEIADGDAQAMTVTVFHREMADRGPFNDLIHRYAQVFMQSLMQSVACNALHSIEKRCARYLLDVRDRVGGNEIALTQETLAAMLGVRRSSVTLAAGALQRAGLIDHGHKHVVIRDATGLEHAACECYGVIKSHFVRLLP